MENKRRCVSAQDLGYDKEVKEVLPEDASFCVDPSAEVRAMLHCEVMGDFSDFSVGIGRDDEGHPWRCLLGVLYHLTLGCWNILTRSTPTGSSSLAVGAKQLKVIISMCSLDPLTGRHPRNHLQRSSDLIRMSASPGGSATDNSIDRILRMVLTGNGPHTSPRCTSCNKVRRVGNILSTRCFALNDSPLRRCMDLFQTHLQLFGNELGLLVPETRKQCGRPS